MELSCDPSKLNQRMELSCDPSKLKGSTFRKSTELLKFLALLLEKNYFNTEIISLQSNGIFF